MKLLIVESPAKAKTISKYLKDAPGEYVVKASVGHIRDLPKSNKKAIDIEGGFVPHYEISKGKEDIVAELKKLVKKADDVLLATDPDREGEAIAWHIQEATKLKKAKRVVFHEITKDAVLEAIKHPRDIDENLLHAQEARRVLDRLFGYDLSGLIWKKVRYGLSAGRVQSPTLRILMEREREIRAFEPETFWNITADLETAKKEISTFVCEKEPREKSEMEHIVKEGNAGAWTVINVKETEAKRSPKAPFITSTLQQAASTYLGFTPSRTMMFAQRLYEAGLITYMRTDSTTLSKEAQAGAVAEIKKQFGDEYVEARVFKTKSKSAQEAHEAIRPTKLSVGRGGSGVEQEKLYRLIWERTMASQMSDAKILRTKIRANVDAKDPIPDFNVNGSRVLFDGWLAANPGARGDDVELPAVAKGDKLVLKKLEAEEKQTQPPPRYTEAGLVKEMEKRGIGRPSTFANTIRTIVDRGYVEKEGKALHPTDTGDVVSSFLEQHFAKYISDSFTSEMEDELDEIADGKRTYIATLHDFYKPFSQEVQSKDDIEKLTTLGEVDEKIRCPLCDGNMVIKLARAGKFMSCANFPDCTGARTIDGEILEGPKETGEKCPKCEANLIERDGRFGRFVACSSYPKCKFIKAEGADGKPLNSTGVECSTCKKGEMVERKGRFGVFFSCSEYPDCKYAIKAKPTGDVCQMCGALMMEGTKTIPDRCSDKACPNHRPDKLNKE